MNWKTDVLTVLNEIFKELEHQALFHDATHRQLFYEITNCYCSKSFFTPGMIKCMYMAAWDDEHFAQLLTMLSDMSLNSGDVGLHDMAENGELMAEESLVLFNNPSDACIYSLSCSYIEGEPFDAAGIPDNLNEHAKTVNSYTLKAADIIQKICDLSFR